MKRKLTKTQLKVLRRVHRHTVIKGHFRYWPTLASADCEMCMKLTDRGYLTEGLFWTYALSDKGAKALGVTA